MWSMIQRWFAEDAGLVARCFYVVAAIMWIALAFVLFPALRDPVAFTGSAVYVGPVYSVGVVACGAVGILTVRMFIWIGGKFSDWWRHRAKLMEAADRERRVVEERDREKQALRDLVASMSGVERRILRVFVDRRESSIDGATIVRGVIEQPWGDQHSPLDIAKGVAIDLKFLLERNCMEVYEAGQAWEPYDMYTIKEPLWSVLRDNPDLVGSKASPRPAERLNSKLQ